jgi:GPH family glycoside/pentoside/hexuronide:cation symporter
MKPLKISWREKVGYSLGDMAANLVFQMMMIYQLKFYTDVFGLTGAVAGGVLLVAPMVSAFADPLVGIITDRTTTRWGKYRPWLIWTAVPFCVFYLLAFNNPGIEDKRLLAIYATVSYVLLLAMYSFNNTPYASLGGVMTSDIKDRTSINSIRFVASTIAQFVVQGFTLPLVSRLGGSNASRGWSLTILLFALVAFVLLVICFLSTRERIAPPIHQQRSIRCDVKETFGSVSWRAMFFLCFSIYIALSMSGSAMNFYFQSYLDQHSLYEFLHGLHLTNRPEEAYAVGFSLFNIINAAVQFVGVLLLANYLANRYGKKTVYAVGLALTVLLQGMFYLPGATDVRSVYVICFLKSLAYAPTIPLLWAMVADVADHMEYLNHRRATGFCFSGIMFALKMGLGFGGALSGLLLSLFGYVSGGMAIQSREAVYGIRLVSSLIPAALFCIGLAALAFYPITMRYNENMQAELADRRRQEKHLPSP